MLNLQNVQEEAIKIGEQFIAPHTAQIDKEGRFPIEAYTALRKNGFMGLLVPKEFGGVGGNCESHAIACYNLAKFEASTALCYMMHNVASACVAKFGTDSQKKNFLPKVASGDIALALAYSESGSGTHFGSPDITEKEDGEFRILKGRKSFVTSAQQADFYLTYTNSCKGAGLNNWLVSNSENGILHEEGVWNGLGMRGNVSKPVQYNDVRVNTKERLLGEIDGKGGDHAGFVVMYFVVGLGAVYSGLGQAAYECALNHIKTRSYTDGSSLADKEVVRYHIAELYSKAQAQFALVLEAAKALDRGDADAALKVFACRINATELVMQICELAMRLGGGKAYSKLLPLERYMRDCLASQVMAPSLDVLKAWLADAILS